MLVNADWKALEWMGVVYLSKDRMGYDEIERGVDQHSDNQERFGLPDRLTAKKFVFRLIYGGSAYSYAHDADFAGVSTRESFWQDVIDRFYLKYEGIARWHAWLVEEVMRCGQVTLPTGRCFVFSQERGEWPRTTILNYPVQGFSADLMVLARTLFWKRFKANSSFRLSKMLCTVHDSLVLDCPDEELDNVVKLLYDVWNDIPEEFERTFGMKFDLPCKVEVSVGPNWKDMEVIEQ